MYRAGDRSEFPSPVQNGDGGRGRITCSGRHSLVSGSMVVTDWHFHPLFSPRSPSYNLCFCDNVRRNHGGRSVWRSEIRLSIFFCASPFSDADILGLAVIKEMRGLALQIFLVCALAACVHSFVGGPSCLSMRSIPAAANM